MNAELFYSWLFHKWTPAREEGHKVRDEAFYGVPPAQAYLNCKSSLNPLLRAYLETCLSISTGFYEVLDCAAGVIFPRFGGLPTVSIRGVHHGQVQDLEEIYA